jgi:hypothetical protein
MSRNITVLPWHYATATVLAEWQQIHAAVVTATPLFLATIGMILFTIPVLCRDYRAFISLGPGGTPGTPVGYVRIKVLGLFACKDPYKPVPVPKQYRQQAGFLSTPAFRQGPRPMVRGIAPHRQVDQKATPAAFNKLRDAIEKLAKNNGTHLMQKTSCLEKHGPGLFALNAQRLTPHCSGEVCHVHPSDGSLHLTLHPADAKRVLNAGWGERHPLGSGGWLSRFVPPGFLMVYAPRTEKEVETVFQIIIAAIRWIGNVDIDSSELKIVREREIEKQTWHAQQAAILG